MFRGLTVFALLAGCTLPLDGGPPSVDGEPAENLVVLSWSISNDEGILCDHEAAQCGEDVQGDCTFEATVWLSTHDHPGRVRDVQTTAHVVAFTGDTTHVQDLALPDPHGTWEKRTPQKPTLTFTVPCDAERVTASMNIQADGWFSAQTLDVHVPT